jgi:hypothetical protein
LAATPKHLRETQKQIAMARDDYHYFALHDTEVLPDPRMKIAAGNESAMTCCTQAASANQTSTHGDMEQTTNADLNQNFNAKNSSAESRLKEFEANNEKLVPQKVYIIAGHDWFTDEDGFNDNPNHNYLISQDSYGFQGYIMADLDQDILIKAVSVQERLQKRSSCSLRALAFVNRAIKAPNSHWDSISGNVLLLMTSILKCSKGQLKIDSTSFCSQAVGCLESHSNCKFVGAEFDAESPEQMKQALSHAKGLVAMQWLGKSANIQICQNVWNRVMKSYVSQRTAVHGDLCTRLNVCSNCAYNNEAGTHYCKICTWTIQTVFPSSIDYDEILQGLECCHILSELVVDPEDRTSAERKNLVGLGLMRNVLQKYHAMYPYSSVGKLGRAVYRKQCLCVTRLILTLSNLGSSKLQKSDFPAEWIFLNAELKTLIEVTADTELVGKFIFCLSILGGPGDRESNWMISKGLQFLHHVEGWFGNTGRWTDTDASISHHYNTSWSAAVAMIDPVHTLDESISQYVQLWSTVVTELNIIPSIQVDN